MAVVADVFDVVLIDTDGDTIGSTTLTEANIEVQVQENEVRGGKGNQLLGTLHSDRDITINLTDINFRYEWVAKQLGQDIKTGAGVAYAMPKWYKVTENAGEKEFILDHTPLSPESVKIYDEGGNKLELNTDFAVSTNKITISDAAIAAGHEVEVRTYQYQTEPTTQTIVIDNSIFAKGVMAILETLEVDESTEKATHRLQYQFPNTIPSGNFSLNTSSERTATAQAFNLRVVKPKTSTKVGEILRFAV